MRILDAYDILADAAETATTAVQQTLSRGAKSPAFGVAMIACLVYVSVDGAGAPPFPLTKATVRDAAVTPVAAVARASTDPTGPLVIAALHPKTGFHIAESALSAPPPSLVVSTPGTLGIPNMALTAYRNAERMMATSDPNCGISWNLLAGIGRIESSHANGGATDAKGTAVRPIYGPSLDGTLPGNEVIVQSSAPGRVSYARAMGPMQFLPGTWAHYASDGDGDGTADPQNLYDATLAAARYLCSGGLNLRDQQQVLSAILRYNNSMPYAQNVLGWAAAYATGVVPVDLPPLTGAPPPLGDAHLEHAAEGLGPNLPLNMHGLSTADPMSRMPLIDLSGNPGNGQPWSAQGPAGLGPSCTVICIGQQAPGPAQINAPVPDALAPQAPIGLMPPPFGAPAFLPPQQVPPPAAALPVGPVPAVAAAPAPAAAVPPAAPVVPAPGNGP
ncbi:lytic murein transglycosylase [Candidatus Mycobacterium wuenschmannii]|uniref:Lytic murein transglycosylase n=1 Tax=Candidatus Mycobacterium wuenschmannii TaxID=3027808 RepID=A0ABY8W347_9MYCO|nr:lytic murein transglycosylase [Candidatus Mycobacterium wuenschmannii]WIM90289.1 lytic murein transglycosylase [Candidatus Mycobacterium wuenschmannii]